MSDLDAIDSVHQAFVTAFNAADAGGLAAQAADDAIFMPPNAPRSVGGEAFSSFAQEAFFDRFAAEVIVVEREVTVIGDVAIEHGAYEMSMTPVGGGDSVQDSGSWLATFARQDDGSWKITRDIWNSDQPAPAA